MGKHMYNTSTYLGGNVGTRHVLTLALSTALGRSLVNKLKSDSWFEIDTESWFITGISLIISAIEILAALKNSPMIPTIQNLGI